MTTITSRQNSVVTRFRAAARARQPTRELLLLEGARLVEDALAAGASIEVALFSVSALQSEPGLSRLERSLTSSGVPIHTATESVLRAASPVRTPSGVVALASHRPRPFDRVVEDAGAGFVVAAVGVQDPGNVGAIIRAADAGGARAVVVTGGSADPFGWRALRGAMGSSFRLPVAAVDDLVKLVEAVRARGTQIVAAVPRGGTGLYEADLTGPRLVLVGQEGGGLTREINQSADLRVSVPMRRQVDSLNVAVAAALLIYEARRQTLRRRRGRRLTRGTRRKST